MHVLDHEVVLAQGRADLLGPLLNHFGVVEGGNGQDSLDEDLGDGHALGGQNPHIGAAVRDLGLVEECFAVIEGLLVGLLEHEAQLLHARHGELGQRHVALYQCIDLVHVGISLRKIGDDGSAEALILFCECIGALGVYSGEIGIEAPIPLRVAHRALERPHQSMEGKDVEQGDALGAKDVFDGRAAPGIRGGRGNAAPAHEELFDRFQFARIGQIDHATGPLHPLRIPDVFEGQKDVAARFIPFVLETDEEEGREKLGIVLVFEGNRALHGVECVEGI